MAIRLKSQAWRELRREYESGKSAAELSKRFGVKPSTIHGRASREKWREHTGPNFPQAADVSAIWACLADAAITCDLGMAMAAVGKISAIQKASFAHCLEQRVTQKARPSVGGPVSHGA